VIVRKSGITCLEGDRIRDSNREVCKHGKKFVSLDAFESEIMGDFVDC
jgi:hypothetical protein